ncbi:MAG: alpha/beta fold hydrolase [Candidatus Aminicenantes bacterium]|nr:alpha/beta fold hydrolase [Candidatus Aminicenantes bacterium]
MIKTLKRSAAAVIILFALVLFLFKGDSRRHTADSQNNESVILLHGLFRSFHSLEKLERYLSEWGYRVINLDYPSTKQSIPDLADNILDTAVQQCCQTSQEKIHFVTHSMGGIVVRYYLKHHDLPQLGRVVMLSPPNGGSELADFLKKSPLFNKTRGPAGLQLGTGAGSLPLELGPVDFELGIISGNRSFYLLNSALIPGPDDGIVSVERTKVEGMADFLLLPYSHTFIMQKEAVFEQVVHFLREGKFSDILE